MEHTQHKLACLVWAVVNFKKRFINHVLTHPLPEDVAAHQCAMPHRRRRRRCHRRRAQPLRRRRLHRPRRRSAATRALALARTALTSASRPFKYVTNWCYAKRGTATLAAMVRGWTEARPEAAVLDDDVAAMYQWVCRATAFAAIRRHFPELLTVFRFFYFAVAIIWFGGATVPIAAAADGSTILSPGSNCVLRSCDGGCQGCGGATLLCVLPYHLTLGELQRRRPTSDIAATADDSYYCDELAPPDASHPPSPAPAAASSALDTARALLPAAGAAAAGDGARPSSLAPGTVCPVWCALNPYGELRAAAAPRPQAQPLPPSAPP